MRHHWRRRGRLFGASVCALGALAACNSRKVQTPYCEIAGQQSQIFEPVSRKVDLLFLIDDSSSTETKQRNIICNFPKLVDTLERIPGGLPDLHVGVVSSSMGSGAFALTGCGDNKDGAFQAAPRPVQIDCSLYGGTSLDTTGCTGPTGKGYIDYRSSSDNNVAGQPLATAFSCVAALGSKGCGFEQSLQAVARSLERSKDPMDAVNGGFVRDDALLVVVVLTDEDDCSLPADSWLADTRDGVGLSSPLGPLDFRCTDRGFLCGGQHPPRDGAGQALSCQPDDGAFVEDPRHALLPVADLVRRVQAAKSADKTIVEAIAGPAPPDGELKVVQLVNPMTGASSPVLGPSCDGGTGGTGVGTGAPAVRVQKFLEAFDTKKRIVNICQRSFAASLDSIAHRIEQRLKPCLKARPLDRQGLVARRAADADCQVHDVQMGSSGPDCRIPIPRCGQGPLTPPACAKGLPAGYAERTCFFLEEGATDEQGKPLCEATNLAVRVCRGGYDAQGKRCLDRAGEAPTGSTARVACASCTPTNGGVECVGDGIDNDCDGNIDDKGEPCECS